MNKRRGSSFNSYLEEEGIRDEVELAAIKNVIALQLNAHLKANRQTKDQFARELHTSRAQLDRLLDPNNLGVTLGTLAKAAKAMNKKLVVSFEEDGEAA